MCTYNIHIFCLLTVQTHSHCLKKQKKKSLFGLYYKRALRCILHFYQMPFSDTTAVVEILLKLVYTSEAPPSPLRANNAFSIYIRNNR